MSRRASLCFVALAAFLLFLVPAAVFQVHNALRAPFYFLAPDASYYLGIALHSAHLPFFSNDTVHPTNGFHPLWEWTIFAASKLPYFNLMGDHILQRFLAANLILVSVATSLFAAYVYRHTNRPLLSILAATPGLLWFLGCGVYPAGLNDWNFVNGMESGVELLFFVLAAHLFGRSFRIGWRYYAACACLGLMVLSRLDDVFFLLAFGCIALYKAPSTARFRTLAGLVLPALMLLGYLFYNHRTVGVWMPVSGAAKAGVGYRSNLGETLHVLGGQPFWSTSPGAYIGTYAKVVQLMLPILIATAYLLWSYRRPATGAVVQALAAGTLLKGLYILLVVKMAYQGDWYFAVPVAVCNLILALWASEVLSAKAPILRTNSATGTSLRTRYAFPIAAVLALAVINEVSYNDGVAQRLLSFDHSADIRLYQQREQIAQRIRATGHPTFLEFQDGALSLWTGLPSVAGFGLASDPEAVRAQKNGTFFQLMQQRGVTVAAASEGYVGAISGLPGSTGVLASSWGYNAEEIQHIRFEPFYNDPSTGLVLAHIVRIP